MPTLEEHITEFDKYLEDIKTSLKATLQARNVTIEKDSNGNDKDKISDLLKCLLSYDPVPVGTVIASYARTAPTGYLPCDGRSITIQTTGETAKYEQLYKYITGETTGNVNGKTLNIPNLSGKFIQGCFDQNGVGTIIPAGLPNITGTLLVDDSMYNKPGNYYTGVFTKGAYFGSWDLHSQGGGYSSGWINLDARNCSEVYKNNFDTVQPPAVCLNYYIKY